MGETPIQVPHLAGLEPIHGTNESGHAFFACELAAQLPSPGDYWFAYIHKGAGHNAEENHFILHSPDLHPRSLLYCRVETYGTKRGRLHICPGAHYSVPERNVPALTRDRPICREEISVNPERGPVAIAKDIGRRLLPQGLIHWQQADEYADRKGKAWASYVDVVSEVCAMGGIVPPEEKRLAGGMPYPERWSRSLNDEWHLEIRGHGSYELTKHGEVSEDLFDVLDQIGWGEDG